MKRAYNIFSNAVFAGPLERVIGLPLGTVIYFAVYVLMLTVL